MSEGGGDCGLKLHRLVRHRMIETQQPGVQTETVQRVVAVAVFAIATNGMSHISSMNANLVLTTRLQLKLYQRVVCRAVHHEEMSDSQLATIVDRR